MEHQEQRQRETLASQLSPCTEERQDKQTVMQSYCSPQVYLIGDAKHLMAGSDFFGDFDSSGLHFFNG